MGDSLRVDSLASVPSAFPAWETLKHQFNSRSNAAEETVPGIRGIGRVCLIYVRSFHREPEPDREELA